MTVKTDAGVVIESFAYGASRQRLITTQGSLTTYYAWGGSSVLCEYTETTGNGATFAFKKSYIYAGSRLLSTQIWNGTAEITEFHHPDRLGTKLVTNNAANTSYEQSTLPFGTALNAESSGFSNQVFTSYDHSASTGLDYAVNRSYSSGQGRFTTVDPIGFGASSLGSPQSLNLYAYVENNPIDFVDPSGLNKAAPHELMHIINSEPAYTVRNALAYVEINDSWFNAFDASYGGSFDWLYDPVIYGGETGGGGGSTDPTTQSEQKVPDISFKELFSALQYCIETLWKSKVRLDSLLRATPNGLGRAGTSFVQQNGSLLYQPIETDAKKYNADQITLYANAYNQGSWKGITLPKNGKKNVGVTFPGPKEIDGKFVNESPYLNYVANNANQLISTHPTLEKAIGMTVVTQIHELGNSIRHITGVNVGDPNDPVDKDSGMALERCVAKKLTGGK